MKKIICVENGKIYKSVSEASQELGIDKGNISKVCKGKLKTAGGYRFEYVTNSDWRKIPQVIEYRNKALQKMQEQKNRIEELEKELARLRAINNNELKKSSTLLYFFGGLNILLV